MRLLCVDDNSTVCRMLDTLLTSSGMDVDFAANGREAVEAYEESEYDAILMDIELPVLSGIEAVREIRQIEQGHNLNPTPILFLTGHPHSQVREAGQTVGGDGVLAKPFTPEALLSALDRIRHMPKAPCYPGGMAAHA
ncbi:response regulator [Asticcacaulis sp. DW145]|uniref:response regulator n=1 Tax=Asticcacaulis sp. DW145 TaxID=3095608 RepID=UPI0030910484|nr:response regulator [Asticcacaulis sp. DW145]